jgi:hypothetical protein
MAKASLPKISKPPFSGDEEGEDQRGEGDGGQNCSRLYPMAGLDYIVMGDNRVKTAKMHGCAGFGPSTSSGHDPGLFLLTAASNL